MNFIDRAVAFFSPVAGLARSRARAALRITANYDAATPGNRGSSWRKTAADADTANSQRKTLAYVARDMARNTRFAPRAKAVITSNVVGDGIIPRVKTSRGGVARAVLVAIEKHFDSTDIDADGRSNLYGLQRLAMDTVIEAGEVLIRRRRRSNADGFAVPFQIQVMEPDFLCDTMDGNTTTGTFIHEGIEFDAIGRRVAYHLYDEHPGASGRFLRAAKTTVRRVPASEIIHVYRQDRPGQQRGVSWFAPVAMSLQDHADYMNAQLMRQKIAALFAAFVTTPDGDPIKADATQDAEDSRFGTMEPGRIEKLAPGETLEFANPPGVEGFDEFTRVNLRAVAADMGITYEALSGDLGQVNFSSARIGRLEMERNISAWQWLMLVPQMMDPLARWFAEAWQVGTGKALPDDFVMSWAPPAFAIADPSREIPTMVTKIRNGLLSRSSAIRSLGYDAERINEEIIADNAYSDGNSLIFDCDPRRTAAGGTLQSTKNAESADDTGDAKDE